MCKQCRIREKRNRHHIKPRSRGGGSGDNLIMLCAECHFHYHQNFNNMTPDEIINFLVEHYWNNQWFWVAKALDRFAPHRGA